MGETSGAAGGVWRKVPEERQTASWAKRLDQRSGPDPRGSDPASPSGSHVVSAIMNRLAEIAQGQQALGLWALKAKVLGVHTRLMSLRAEGWV